MGAKIPPPRAVFEGTTGPNNNSTPQIEYPNPKGDFAKRLTNKSANRRPNPVRIIPPASRKSSDDQPDHWVAISSQRLLRCNNARRHQRNQTEYHHRANRIGA